jgi:hypothetical protein
MADPYAQVSLWPAPQGGLVAADAHAIKVSRYHYRAQNSIPTDFIWLEDHPQFAPEIS